MKPDARIIELCERLVSPGHAPSKLSASELHELADFIFDLEVADNALKSTIEAAILAMENVPCVGKVYDQQHADTQMRARQSLRIALGLDPSL